METPVRKKYGLLFLITCLISYQVKYASGFHTFEDYLNEKCPHDTIKVLAPGEDEHDKCCTALRTNDPRECLIEACKYRLGSLTWQKNCKAVNGNLTLHDYQNAKCDDDTIKCPPNAACCLKDSRVCINRSNRCEDVFKPDEDKHDTCCTALRKNDTTREGLIEVCKYRLGSLTWQQNCSKEPKGESPSTVEETKPPPTVVPTEQQKEKVTPSSGASSDGKFGEGIGTGIAICLVVVVVVALIICVAISNKLTRKGSYTICQFKTLSTSSPGTSGGNHEESDRESENNDTSGPQGQQEDKACINPESGSEPREDVTEDTSLEDNPSRRLAQRRLGENS